MKDESLNLKCIWSEDDATLHDLDRRTLKMEWKDRFGDWHLFQKASV